MGIMKDEAHKLGLRTAHHAAVAETNAWYDVKYGTTSIEHWYGVQNFPAQFNHQYEVDRFRYAGHLFRQTDPVKLGQILDGMVKANVAWSPTMNIYEAARDLLRYQRQEAGFHPLQAITQATSNNAKIMGKATELGYVRPGYLADLIVVDGNPLADFPILYPKTERVPQSGKIEWTIKDGIAYHGPTITSQVKRIVEQDRKSPQPRATSSSAADEEAH